jgi:hypothetical protein
MNKQILYLFSFLATAVPFAFGAIRAVQTRGADLRYLWMALASYIAAAAVVAIVHTRQAPALGFGAAALVAMLTGYLLGARGAVGIAIVAMSFALCWVAGYVLRVRARPAV